MDMPTNTSTKLGIDWLGISLMYINNLCKDSCKGYQKDELEELDSKHTAALVNVLGAHCVMANRT